MKGLVRGLSSHQHHVPRGGDPTQTGKESGL